MRPRRIRSASRADSTTPSFPAQGSIQLDFHPPRPFGESGPGRTTLRGRGFVMLFDPGTGHHRIEAESGLTPLNVEMESESIRWSLSGSKLTVESSFKSVADLRGLIETIYFFLPPLLNIDFIDPPTIKAVGGSVHGKAYHWRLAEWKSQFEPTTQSEQERAAFSAVQRLAIISNPSNRRLAAALHYFHIACRLDRVARAPGEFLAETILNLAKVLDVLFSSGQKGNTRDAARKSLRALNYTDAEIEADFLPAQALRSSIDVAHAGLAIFAESDLALIHEYTDRAETVFRKLFRRLLESIEKGEFALAPPDDLEPGPAAQEVVRRFRARAQLEQK